MADLLLKSPKKPIKNIWNNYDMFPQLFAISNNMIYPISFYISLCVFDDILQSPMKTDFSLVDNLHLKSSSISLWFLEVYGSLSNTEYLVSICDFMLYLICLSILKFVLKFLSNIPNLMYWHQSYYPISIIFLKILPIELFLLGPDLI